MGASGQRHAPGKGPRLPIVQEAGWAGVDTEVTGKNSLALPRIEPRSPGRHPARININS
jgi:hypothetical protein